MCSVDNLEGIVITDRDGVIILEGKPEEGIASFTSVLKVFLVKRLHMYVQHSLLVFLVTSADFPRSMLKPTYLATFGVASEKVCTV